MNFGRSYTLTFLSWGGTVVRISDASQMPKKAIDIAQKFYRSYAAGEAQ